MSKVEYEQYLQSEHWKIFRRKVYAMIRRCGACSVSGEIRRLNIHHLNYDCLFNETLKDVVVLCEDCHHLLHTSEKLGIKQSTWLRLHCPRLYKNKEKRLRKRVGQINQMKKRRLPTAKRAKLKGLTFVQNLSLEEWKVKHSKTV